MGPPNRGEGKFERARRRVAFFGALALALSVGLALILGGPAAAAKKKKKAKVGGIADITTLVGVQVPDGTATTNGLLPSTATVTGKQFRNTQVRDVNVTVQTTGTGASAATDLQARLTAPNGATSWLLPTDGSNLSGTSVGPLTLDDESPNRLGGLPPAPNATTLVAPYFGVAQPNCAFSRGGCTLSALDGGPASGVWTLRFYDTTPTDTSVLNSWRLVVQAGKPFRTK
jgi:subtilisin-like proprotein convertase family protein